MSAARRRSTGVCSGGARRNDSGDSFRLSGADDPDERNGDQAQVRGGSVSRLRVSRNARAHSRAPALPSQPRSSQLMPKVRSSRKRSVSGPAFRWPLTIPHVPASVEAYARCRLILARLFRVAADLHDDELARAWIPRRASRRLARRAPGEARWSLPGTAVSELQPPGPRGQPQEHRSHAIADGVDVRRDAERGPPAGVDPACAVHALGPVARFAPTRSDPRHPSPVRRRCASTPGAVLRRDGCR